MEFLRAARRGLELVKKRNRAGAREALTEAVQWWGGPFLPGTSEVERLTPLRSASSASDRPASARSAASYNFV